MTERYFANSKVLVMHVALADKPSIAQQYQATISIIGDIEPKREITMTTNVDSLEDVPQKEEEFLNSANCWMIPIQQLTAILDSRKKEGHIMIFRTFKIQRKDWWDDCHTCDVMQMHCDIHDN